ncbi:MBL fold metallo-hydrolase [Massilia sp. S19_KUP03_FR1]|uniref:MBL fold metallo-hydrolase n=1 Tax=Massilia sp. S19_KUP03_FR1 TaxID=3025503 RepID=UPI002FCDD91A
MAEPPSNPVRELTSVPVGHGIWRINNGTTVVECGDHLVLFELAVLPDEAKATLAFARKLGRGKPIRYLVASHNHFDHTLGLRQAVAQGIPVIQRPTTLAQFHETISRAAPDYPDDLARSPQPFKTHVMGDHLRLQDSTQTLDLYWGRSNGHMADVIFAYAPEQKVMMEGDLVTAAYEWQNWPDTFRDVTAYYKLDVQKISPVHAVWKAHPDVLIKAQAEQLLQAGTKRARERCEREVKNRNYIPGCPIQSKYD